MKYHTRVSRAREHDQEVLDEVSGGVSLAHNCTQGCAIPPKTPAFRGGWTRQQSAKRHHHNRTETSKEHNHFIHLTLFTPVAPKTGAAPPTFPPSPTLPPSRASLICKYSPRFIVGLGGGGGLSTCR